MPHESTPSGPKGCDDPVSVPLMRPTPLGLRPLRPFAWVDGIPVFGSDDSAEWFVPPADSCLDVDGLPPPDAVLRLAEDPEQIACATTQRRIMREQVRDRAMMEAVFGPDPQHWSQQAFALFEAADAACLGFPVGRPGTSVTDGFPLLGHAVACFASLPSPPMTSDRPSPASLRRLLLMGLSGALNGQRITLWRLRDRAHLVGVSCGGPWAVPAGIEVDGVWKPSVDCPALTDPSDDGGDAPSARDAEGPSGPGADTDGDA